MKKDHFISSILLRMLAVTSFLCVMMLGPSIANGASSAQETQTLTVWGFVWTADWLDAIDV